MRQAAYVGLQEHPARQTEAMYCITVQRQYTPVGSRDVGARRNSMGGCSTVFEHGIWFWVSGEASTSQIRHQSLPPECIWWRINMSGYPKGKMEPCIRRAKHSSKHLKSAGGSKPCIASQRRGCILVHTRSERLRGQGTPLRRSQRRHT